MRPYERIPAWLVPPFLVGAALALGGAYWDDATHTDKGRDSFLIPPHIALYAGVMLAGAGLGVWAALFMRSNGVSAVWGQRGLVLAIVAVAVTLGAGPVDNFWHLAFGRDAVLWSPPHMLGIVGTAGIAVAVLVELVRSPARWAAALRPVAGGMVLAALAISVMEYDTDVPQFAVVWYLPVLAFASATALGLVKLVNDARLAATAAAGVHLAFIGAVAAFLTAEGFDTPKMPLLLVPALVLDVLAARAAPAALVAGAYTAALYAAYVPLLDLTGNGIRLGLADVAAGAPIAFAGVWLALLLTRRPGGRRAVPPRAAVIAGTLLALQLSGAAAWAHDPGQGTLAGSVDLTAIVSGKVARVTGRPDLGGRVDPVGIVARRAGMVRRARLTRSGGTLTGSVALPDDGRWFVYLEMQRRAKRIESWLPVKIGDDQKRFTAPHRFAYYAKPKSSSALKAVATVLLYAIVIGLMAAIVRLARAASQSGSYLGA